MLQSRYRATPLDRGVFHVESSITTVKAHVERMILGEDTDP